jgi:hypothetical protein
MRRTWIRVIVAIICGVIVVAALYVASLALPLRFGDPLWTALDWPPYSFYGWLPHERGQGPTLVIILAPVVINMVIASIVLYIAFTIWSQRRLQLTPKT